MNNRIIYISALLVSLFVACANSAPKEEQKREIPADAIAMEYQNQLYFDVILHDSIHARMIFDTGNTNILLDSTYYAKNFSKNNTLRRAMIAGAGNSRQMAYLDMSGWDYRVGKQTQSERMAIVINLRKIIGERVDGMFGMAFMQGKRVEIDYDDSYMRVLTAEEQIPSDFTRIECKWLDESKSRIIAPIAVTLGNSYVFSGQFMVDTGMSGTLSFNSATANKLKAEKHITSIRSMVYAVGGIGGSRTDYVLKSPQIALGGKAINDVRISWSANDTGAAADTRYDGVIGNELLSRFDVIFDFINCAIYIRPNSTFSNLQPNNLGIVLTPNADHWVVNGLLEGGNAEKAGLRRGDRIEAINGIKATDSYAKSLFPLAEKATLTVKRNSEVVEITVEKEE